MASETIPSRDLKIDLVRGIAILILFSDHVPNNIVAEYTPLAVGLSDMSDVFVFLSGYSCGISYGRRFASGGFVNCLSRAWTRAGQVFAIKVLVTLLSLRIIQCTNNVVTPRFFGVPWNMELVRRQPIETLLEIETFRLELFQYFVLALYIPFLLLLPLAFLGLVKHAKMTFMASSLLYAAVQIYPDTIALPEPWRGAMYFNPFAWQFLFFSACGLALMSANNRLRLRPRWPVAVPAFMLLVAVVVVHCQWGIPHHPFVDKRNLGILRLFHLVAVVITGWSIGPRDPPYSVVQGVVVSYPL